MAPFIRKKTKKVRKLIKLEHIFENLEKETIHELQLTYRDVLNVEKNRNMVGRVAPEEHIKDEILYVERTLKNFKNMTKKDIAFLKKNKETGKIATRFLWIIQAISRIRLDLKKIIGVKSRALKKDDAHLKQITTRLTRLMNQTKK